MFLTFTTNYLIETINQLDHHSFWDCHKKIKPSAARYWNLNTEDSGFSNRVEKAMNMNFMYSSSFGVTLLMMTIIAALAIYSVAINFVLSLGMVGAGFLTVAAIGAVTIAAILFIFVRGKPKDTPYMMVVSCDDDSAENDVVKVINYFFQRSIEKKLEALLKLFNICYTRTSQIIFHQIH